MLRAGTYVTGMPLPISASSRPFGTGMSAVSADPPIARRSSSMTSCDAAESAVAMRAAAASSTTWRCPYLKLSAWHRRPVARVIARAVAESIPPESSTIASLMRVHYIDIAA